MYKSTWLTDSTTHPNRLPFIPRILRWSGGQAQTKNFRPVPRASPRFACRGERVRLVFCGCLIDNGFIAAIRPHIRRFPGSVPQKWFSAFGIRLLFCTHFLIALAETNYYVDRLCISYWQLVCCRKTIQDVHFEVISIVKWRRSKSNVGNTRSNIPEVPTHEMLWAIWWRKNRIKLSPPPISICSHSYEYRRVWAFLWVSLCFSSGPFHIHDLPPPSSYLPRHVQ